LALELSDVVRGDAVLGNGCKCGVDLAIGTGPQEVKLKTNCACRLPHGFQLARSEKSG